MSALEARARAGAQMLLGGLVLIAVPPALAVALLGAGGAEVLGLMAAVPLIEYVAAPLGIGLGLEPAVAWALTVAGCMGIIMAMMALFALLEASSARVQRFLEGARGRLTRHPRLARYGVLGLAVFVIFLGIYIAPAIAAVAGWKRLHAAVCMLAGVSATTLLLTLAALGIIALF